MGVLSPTVSGAAPPTPDAVHGDGRRGGHRLGRTVLQVLAVVVVLLVPVRLWVAEPLHIVTGSMSPTLTPGEHVLSWKLRLLAPPLERGDVVALDLGSGSPQLKRVVGLGGDRVALRDGHLVVNGRTVQESYADPSRIDSVYFGPVRVAKGHVFVLGDNRRNSRDSRAYGAVPVDAVSGRVGFVIWPFDSWGEVPR